MTLFTPANLVYRKDAEDVTRRIRRYRVRSCQKCDKRSSPIKKLRLIILSHRRVNDDHVGFNSIIRAGSVAALWNLQESRRIFETGTLNICQYDSGIQRFEVTGLQGFYDARVR